MKIARATEQVIEALQQLAVLIEDPSASFLTKTTYKILMDATQST